MLLRRVFILAILVVLCLDQSSSQQRGSGAAIVVDIDGEIDLSTAAYVRRSLDEAAGRNARLVILRVNTFGGRVDAATRIRDAIFECPLPTIAFVDDRAISAGAIIALACTKVAMAPGATIGAVTPVDAKGEKAAEKVVSFMRGEMRAVAERRGRDPKIAEAMVDETVTITDTILKPRGQLLTLTTQEALRVGYCDVEALDYPNAMEKLGFNGVPVEPISMSWAEHAVHFLTNPLVASILIIVGLGGIFYTIKTGHLGVATGAGVGAMMLFFGAQYIADLATLLEVGLFIVGIVLLLLEIFVIPGFGVPGVAGILMIVAGLFLSLIGSFDHITFETLTEPLYTLAGAFIGLAVLLLLMFRYLPETGAFRRFVMDDSVSSGKGYVSSPDFGDLQGLRGVAITTLRPAGVAEVDGERYDVVTEGEYVSAGEMVDVVHVEGRKIVVRPAHPHPEERALNSGDPGPLNEGGGDT